jgi:hypothetical protein
VGLQGTLHTLRGADDREPACGRPDSNAYFELGTLAHWRPPSADLPTNYDLTMLGEMLVDGLDSPHPVTGSHYHLYSKTPFPLSRVIFKPEVWLHCQTHALFHLHGAANYFVDPKTSHCSPSIAMLT